MDKKTKKDFFENDRKAHYEAADQNEKLVINFHDVHHTMRFLSEGRGSQKRILIMLLESGTITQRKLTERIGIQPGSASEVLAKLEKAGLITRTESPDDRRTTDIVLTDQGRQKAEEAAGQRRTREREMFFCLTQEEKDTLLALLEKVNTDWQERYQGMKERACDRHERGEEHGHHHGQDEGHDHHHHDHSGIHDHGDDHHHDHGHHGGHEHFHENGTEKRGDCDGNCLECPHPCGRGRRIREMQAQQDQNHEREGR